MAADKSMTRGVLRLALAVVAFAMMATVAALSYDMNTLIRDDPLLYAPLAVVPTLWLVAAAWLTLQSRDPATTGITVSVAVVAVLSLCMLDGVHRQWSYIGTGRHRWVTLGVRGEWTVWLPYPIGLIALAVGLAVRRREFKATARPEGG
jgi:hypothetical protein